MRMQLVARDALIDRMDRKGFSNRRLAKYAECAPGTIDNLVSGRTRSVNNPRTAELICEALDVPMDIFFVPELSSNARRSTAHKRATARLSA
ncbi:helix-turn-helix domain-containing protein [Rhodococcus rhodochrous]|uniref:helix-turn-helix domain-containing protein n=1 Tax=Rhodococcus rhodochrous TaxID=1829 RepID=UPI000AEC1425|nr:helix-turn-helix transcriptional regulator [Rhodococcus rhodochrous]